MIVQILKISSDVTLTFEANNERGSITFRTESYGHATAVEVGVGFCADANR
jgi:hypothetical protein